MSEANRLSLVPYVPEHSREIILYAPRAQSGWVSANRSASRRHDSTVVVWDQSTKQLALRELSHSNTIDLTKCPTCRRPLLGASHKDRESSPTEIDQDSNFMNPAYFRLLHHSSPNSAHSSRPPSPSRQLPQSTEQVRDTSLHPPPGTEFVGSEPSSSATHGISSNALSPEYFNKFFVEERELGRGGKGVVLLVRHEIDGVYLGHFACKRVPVGDDHAWLEKVLIEVQLLQNLSHQNLVSYRHVWLEDYQITPFGPSVPCAFILQQFCNAGDLQEYVLDSSKQTITKEQMKERMRRRSKGQMETPVGLRPRKMQFEEIFSFFRDITSGLNHLHSHGFIHRDLKPSNCLLHQTGTKIRVLVSDFGEVQMENMARQSSGATGTLAYSAPEVLRKETPAGAFENFTTKSDVFSLGMIVYFMCFGRLPYSSADDINNETEDLDQLREEIAAWAGIDEEWKAHSNLPDKLYHALKSLLAINPHDRPSTDEILRAIINNRNTSSTPEDLDRSPRSPILDDHQRISSAESPSPSPRRMQSSKSLLPSRHQKFTPPGPSNLRAVSPETNGQPSISPPKSPTKGPHDKHTRDTEEYQKALIRSRRTSPDHLPGRISPSLKSPLALPPPPPRTILTLSLSSSLRIATFLAKYISLTQPCAPFAASPWVSAPLMVLAALDFVSVGATARNRPREELIKSLALIMVHVLLFFAATKAGMLCQGEIFGLVDEGF